MEKIHLFCNREKCLSKVQPCFILIYSLCLGVFLTKLSSRDCCRLKTNLLLFFKFSVSLHQIKSYPMRKTSEGTNREPCCCFVLMVLFDMYNTSINSPFGAFSHPNRQQYCLIKERNYSYDDEDDDKHHNPAHRQQMYVTLMSIASLLTNAGQSSICNLVCAMPVRS